jgi:hypothetical protein
MTTFKVLIKKGKIMILKVINGEPQGEIRGS